MLILLLRVVSELSCAAPFLPFLGTHMPQIMAIATASYAFSKKLHGWFTAFMELLGALSPIAGEYHAPHTVRVVCEDGWCVEETELDIDRASPVD